MKETGLRIGDIQKIREGSRKKVTGYKVLGHVFQKKEEALRFLIQTQLKKDPSVFVPYVPLTKKLLKDIKVARKPDPKGAFLVKLKGHTIGYVKGEAGSYQGFTPLPARESLRTEDILQVSNFPKQDRYHIESTLTKTESLWCSSKREAAQWVVIMTYFRKPNLFSI